MTFYETFIGEKWQPRKCPSDAAPVNGPAKGSHRAIRALQEIPLHLEKLTLAQLQEILGPDGKFTAGQVQR